MASRSAVRRGVNVDVQVGEEDANKQMAILETCITKEVFGIAVKIENSRHGPHGTTCRMVFDRTSSAPTISLAGGRSRRVV